MRARIYYHQGGDEYHGRVSRRTERYEQGDTRGQYPRPRNNEFAAQPQPRPQARPPMPPAQTPPPRQAEPQREAYRAGEAQYEQPVTPYVPDYIRRSQQMHEPTEHAEFDLPIRQEDYIRRQNPYVVVSEKCNEPRPSVKQRTLIVLAALAVVVLVGVWGSQLVFSAQTQAVFAARAAAEATIQNRHPYSSYRSLIEEQAYANNLNPAFVAAIILNESSFNPDAESNRGARGLMQMMPDTAEWIFGTLGGAAEYSFDLMYDATLNVTYGCWYLRYLSDKFGGDPLLVAAAFHSGQTNVQNWLSDKKYSADQKTMTLETMPDGNTKAYVQKVLNAFAAYERLYYEEVNA